MSFVLSVNYAECRILAHYAECRYAECRAAQKTYRGQCKTTQEIREKSKIIILMKAIIIYFTSKLEDISPKNSLSNKLAKYLEKF